MKTLLKIAFTTAAYVICTTASLAQASNAAPGANSDTLAAELGISKLQLAELLYHLPPAGPGLSSGEINWLAQKWGLNARETANLWARVRPGGPGFSHRDLNVIGSAYGLSQVQIDALDSGLHRTQPAVGVAEIVRPGGSTIMMLPIAPTY